MSWIGPEPVSMEFPVDVFSGNGTNDFLMSLAPAGPTAIDVEIDGASQNPFSSYTIVNGKTLRFYETPAVGTANIVVKHKGLVPSVFIYNKLPFMDYTGAMLNMPLASNLYLPFTKADGSIVNINLASV